MDDDTVERVAAAREEGEALAHRPPVRRRLWRAGAGIAAGKRCGDSRIGDGPQPWRTSLKPVNYVSSSRVFRGLVERVRERIGNLGQSKFMVCSIPQTRWPQPAEEAGSLDRWNHPGRAPRG